MSNLSRRHFLAGAGGVWAAYVLSQANERWLFPPGSTKLGKLVGASPQAAAFIGGPGTPYKVQNNLFFVYDMDLKVHRELEIPLGLAHATLLSRGRPGQALVVERDGPYACLIDTEELKVLQRLECDRGFYFTGSGTFSDDGRKLYLGQYSTGAKATGEISVWDGGSLTRKVRLATGAVFPHSFSCLEDGNLAVGHYYGATKNLQLPPEPLISIYDGKTDRLLTKIQPPVEGLDLCHVEASGAGKLFVLTHNTRFSQGEGFENQRRVRADYERTIAERPAFIDFDQLPSPLVTIDLKNSQPPSVSEAREGFRWGLSLAVNQASKTVAAAHALGGTVSFQRLGSGELLGEHRFSGENPRTVIVSQNENYFVVTTDKGNIVFFDADTLRITRSENPAPGRYNFLVHARGIHS